MRHFYRVNILLFAVVLIGCVLLLPKTAQAQDTLVVQWADGDGFIIENALLTAIEDDTDRPAGRVYKLLRGGFYVNTETIEAPDFHLRLVGESGPADEHPPILQIYRREGGASVTDRMITVGNDLTMKHIYVLGNDDDGIQNSYQPLRITGSGGRQVIENCIFERSNFAMPAWDGGGNTIILRNNIWRNQVPVADNQKWTGRGVSIWNDQDSVIVENNTFFNVNMTAFQIEQGAASYFLFNHNTLVNIGRMAVQGSWWRDAFMANNLIINGWWHGEDANDFGVGRDPRNTHAGMFIVGSLPSMYGPETMRRIVIANNSQWLDPYFTARHDEDGIVPAYFIAPHHQEDFFDEYERMVATDTVWLDQRPNFGTYFDEDQFDAMWDYISAVRTTPANAQPYFWGVATHPLDPDERLHTGVLWPLPEDFSYDDADLMTAGTDGLPLGDLNWFPTQKSQYLANRQQYVNQIQDMGGPTIIPTVVDTKQGHEATLSGNAAVEMVSSPVTVPEGQPEYWIELNGGNFRWDFDLADAGQYDLRLWINMDGEGWGSGQNLFVSGTEIHDSPRGWGEYVFRVPADEDNPVPGHGTLTSDQWHWITIEQDWIMEANALTLDAGANSFEVRTGWNDILYAALEVVPAGGTEPVVSLDASDVAYYEISAVHTYGLDYTPDYFQFVNLGTGSAAWNVTAPLDGIYLVRIFYQNTGSAVSGSLTLNGYDEVINFDSDPDGGRLDLVTEDVELSEGSYTITLSGDNIKVDYIQLIEKRIVTSVRPRDIPEGFMLSQNYPNPFNPSTTIQYTLPATEKVTLKIYNILGQEIATLVNDVQHQGTHIVTFDASRLASGVYLYRIQAGDFTEVKKMMFLK
jgi:hypothetical protein